MKQVLCPNCGEDLCEYGIGHDCRYSVVEYSINNFSNGEVEETIGYYCPECGQSISSEIYDEVINEWEEPTKELKNDWFQ